MKSNIFKYIFFMIVIVLIILAIYMLYKDQNSKIFTTEENVKKINTKEEINIGIVGYDTINPILSNNKDVQYITKLIFEPLLDITKDFKIENKLSKEFSKINSKIYIIKLKDDVYWHDGSKFTAKDVIFTINNLKQKNIKSIYKENVKTIEKVEQIDDYTVKIFLSEETPFFEYKMCFPILCNNSYEEETLNSRTELPNGTGNFKIEKIEHNLIQIKLVNDESEIRLKQINIILKETTKELYDSFTKKEIDYFITDNIYFENYLGTMGYNILQIPNREYEYLVLNNKNNILSNKEIRKALNTAIDKGYINYNIYNNKYINCNYPLYYGSYLHNLNQENNYNVNQAKNILIENGWSYKNNKWTNKNTVLKFNIIVDKENEKRVFVAENIKEQLESIGININIIKVSTNAYNTYLKNKNYDMILTGNIISNSPNIETYYGENNLSNYNNQEVKHLLNDIKNISSEDKLKEKYSEILQICNEETPFISLYSNSLFIISNPELKGDLSCNWYNLFYNIDGWYKVK